MALAGGRTIEQVIKDIRSADSDANLLALVEQNLDQIPFKQIEGILSACKTDEARLNIARLFADKFDEANDSSRVYYMLRAFKDEALRLQCAQIYISKVDIYFVRAVIEPFQDPANRLSLARQAKKKFNFRLNGYSHEQQYLKLLDCLEEEQRFAFVKECLDIITTDLLPKVIEKLTDLAHRAEIAMAFPFQTEQGYGGRILSRHHFHALEESRLLLAADDKRKLALKYAQYLDDIDLPKIVANLETDEARFQVMLAARKNAISSRLFSYLRSPVYRLKLGLELRKRQDSSDAHLHLADIFTEAQKIKPDHQILRASADTPEMKAFIKEIGLLPILKLFFEESPIPDPATGAPSGRIALQRIGFLKLFNPDFLLECIDSVDQWGAMHTACGGGDIDTFLQYFGLQVGIWSQNQIDFHLAMRKLAGDCSEVKHPEHLRTAGLEVVRTFNQVYKSGSLKKSDELKSLQEVAELVSGVITSSDHNVAPLVTRLTDKQKPILLPGEERTRRIVIGAIGAVIYAALAAASIALALVSFGVLAPLTIATITLSTNILVASLATAAAPIALGLGTGATFFAISGRKQGPALAVERFVKQQPKMG